MLGGAKLQRKVIQGKGTGGDGSGGGLRLWKKDLTEVGNTWVKPRRRQRSEPSPSVLGRREFQSKGTAGAVTWKGE